jgi:hypothetical protein
MRDATLYHDAVVFTGDGDAPVTGWFGRDQWGIFFAFNEAF